MYTKQHFIEKLSKIDEKDWGKGALANKCVLWHLGLTFNRQLNDELKAFIELLGYDPDEKEKWYRQIYYINDNSGGIEYPGSTPKERVINYLNTLP